uniref:Glycosyltransferases n=1 Tax=Kalanchoe fedtschenkoi TaxID=63787 RepID=A0A7N0T9I8_KALFE
MKLFALQQSYASRRSNSFRSASPLDLSSEGNAKSPSAVFWLALHGLCCLISLVLGFRFSRLVFFLLFSSSASTSYYSASPFLKTGSDVAGTLLLSSPVLPKVGSVVSKSGVSSRVVVGRHGIRIRPWPHPDPVEVMKAHRIIERVQREQRAQHGVKSPRTVIAVTPTYVRTFQTPHLIGVMHSLMNVPYEVVWIVVEAGGTSNETASIIAKSGLRTMHIGFEQRMADTWEGRHLMEARMRLHALRVVRDEKLDGVVMFADDSNMHSLELFDEIQNVKWFGAVSVGILLHSSDNKDVAVAKEDEESSPLPVQGPACNSSQNIVGWHTFNSLPYKGNSAVHIDDRGVVLPTQLEWAGFVLNSRLVWKEAEGRPDWVKDLDTVDGDVDSPLSLLKDASMVEPLGKCGRKVLLWWLRVEARTDSKFPSGWIINPPLEVTVPAKRTPWPEASPDLPKTEKVVTTEEHTEKRPPKTRTARSKRSSRHKRKHDTQQTNTQDTRRSTEK